MSRYENIIKILLSYYKGLNFTREVIDEFKEVIIIEDSLLLYIEFGLNSVPYNAEAHLCDGYNALYIQELTNNEIIKFNKTKFDSKISKSNVFVEYIRYQGLNSYSYSYQKDIFDKVNQLKPNLNLIDRYNQWNGVYYNVVLLKMSDINNKDEYAIYITKNKPHIAVQRIAKQLLEKTKGELTNNGFSSEPHFIYMKGNYCKGFEFINAFMSHKEVRLKKRLENSLKYSFITTFLKEWRNHDEYANKLLEEVYNYSNKFEWTDYIYPTTRWKNEEIVTKTIQKYYKEFIVIPQHRPYWLKSSFGGQMSYDVYITGLKIAIEYQGQQHFQSVNYFGGDDSYKKVIIRDKEKKKLSELHGVKLVYINYWDNLTEGFIKNKIDEAINEE